jgi:hypothetical protein
MNIQKVWPILKNTIVTCALTHVAILFFVAVKDGNVQLVNIFSILDFTYFFPALKSDVTMFVISWIFLLMIFLFWFWFAKSKKEI